VTLVGDRLFNALAPLTQGDPAGDLRALCNSVGVMFEQVAQIVEPGPKGEPGWSLLLDVDRCPAAALPWLGQFVGVTVDPSLDEAAQRQQIRDEQGMARGTPAAMVAAAKRSLTGTRTVILIERDASVSPTEPAYGLKVLTRTSETPDTAVVLAALIAAKPAGIILDYATIDGQTWQDVIDNYATWGDVISTYSTWQDVIENTP
jgi:P2-related tail formation protein